MGLSFKETQALSDLASHLYAYLPASGAIYTFGEAARDAGVAQCWPGVKMMSKQPAIATLVESVYRSRPEAFCSLIERVVHGGLRYRTKKGDPLTADEIEKLNLILLRLGFKIPELWDQDFLAGLPRAAVPTPSPTTTAQNDPDAARRRRRRESLAAMLSEFQVLHVMTDRQAAGLKLEKLLERLFDEFGLQPEGPFRVVGEQIDGAFRHENEDYLLEARWRRELTEPKDLYAFERKVQGKSRFTRGLFLSVNGFSTDAVPALVKGNAGVFVMMDGAHLVRVLEGHVDLPDLLTRLMRHLNTRGQPYLPVNSL
jgi:hypothetical protein